MKKATKSKKISQTFEPTKIALAVASLAAVTLLALAVIAVISTI